MSSPKCGHCGLYNFAGATACKRCQQPLLYQSAAPQFVRQDMESGGVKCLRCGLYDSAGVTECRRCQQPLLYHSPAVQFNQTHQAENTGGSRDNSATDMVVGGLACLFGIVVTAATYSIAASSSKGGKYVVAWGAIVFGGIRFLKGMFGRY